MKRKEDNMTLDMLKVGESGIIKSVGGEGELRLRLLDMGLIPKTKVMVRKMAPMGHPIVIHIRGYEHTLRIKEAKKIEIESEELDK